MIESLNQAIDNLFSNNIFLVMGGLLLSFVISFLSIPRILAVARMKNLYDEPNGRTSHTTNTPTLGGIAIFASLVLSMMLFIDGTEYKDLQYIVAGLTIMFFIGLKDDILLISPYKKLAGQLVASLILIVLGDIHINNLFGLFGFFELPLYASILVSLFIFIVLINCFNLIDGVDGLASGLGILISLFLTLWLYFNGYFSCAIISISLLGSLIPFFAYNVFGKTNKLFMGDTGSMIIGLIIAILLIKFINHSIITNTFLDASKAAPAIAMSIIFIPLYDMLQVFTLRVLNGRSPFSADKNHLHHLLLRLGLTHLQTTITLCLINLATIVLAFSLQFLGVLILGVVLLGIGLSFSLVLKVLLRRKLV